MEKSTLLWAAVIMFILFGVIVFQRMIIKEWQETAREKCGLRSEISGYILCPGQKIQGEKYMVYDEAGNCFWLLGRSD